MRRSLEFPNVTEMDCMLVHRIFHKFYEKQTSLLLCMQAQPERMEDLFTVKSIDQSIKGRLLQNARRVHLQGPDLRMMGSPDACCP